MNERTDAIVLCGPVVPTSRVLGRLTPGALVIAADVGYRQAAALGLQVDVLVGDLDSLDADEVASARRVGARVERHATDKDATDLELALDLAAVSNVDRVVVVDGGVGPRVDHFIANALLLANPRYAAMEVFAALGEAWISVVRGGTVPVELFGARGSTVTLLPVGGSAESVHTEGLRWQLCGADLKPSSTRGVSNEMTDDRATVRLARGTLLAVQPEDDAQ
jgi:thiamine pyrophosphokinase